MKILLDEQLDWRLRRDLPGHTLVSVLALMPKVLAVLSAVQPGTLTVVS